MIFPNHLFTAFRSEVSTQHPLRRCQDSPLPKSNVSTLPHQPPQHPRLSPCSVKALSKVFACSFVCLPPFLSTGMCCYPHQLTHSRSSANTLKRMTELVFSDYFLNFSINSRYLIILSANRLPPPACKGNLCLNLA